MSGRKNSEENFLCRVNFSFSHENLFPAGGHERVSLPTQHITSIRIGNEVDFTPQHSSSGIGGEGVIDTRVVLPGHPVYGEGVFVLLPGCRHWLRTCSAFLKSCHPCYGIDSPPSFPSLLHLAIKLGSFPRRHNHHKKDRCRSALLRPPPRDRKKFLTPVVVSTICI